MSAKRILIYSHDSFGLGHLRRCRTIAHAIVAARNNTSVLILSGSPIIGNFDFKARVDFVRIPGVIKLRNGEYSPLSLHLSMGEILKLRASIIQHTANAFRPDIFLVDKEPLGLRGEVHKTLKMLNANGTRLVLGLRDVMDDPVLLKKEWQRKNPFPALKNLYDSILIYGLSEIYNPLSNIKLTPEIKDKIIYTGYLEREIGRHARTLSKRHGFDEPYILVTTGGGGDGEELVDWVISAYEAVNDIPYNALIMLGPFMPLEARRKFEERANKLSKVKTRVFDARIESIYQNAAAVIAMGGYNTFCEIISFDKPALLVPRTVPRKEQWIRARAAEQLGLLSMLEYSDNNCAYIMADAIKDLCNQPSPSHVKLKGLLDGKEKVTKLITSWLDNSTLDDNNIVSKREYNS